jgi:hypothetical protein
MIYAGQRRAGETMLESSGTGMKSLYRRRLPSLVAACLVSVASFQTRSAAAMAQAGADLRRAPPAALALALRLGLQSTPFVGDQPNGSGRPWTVWFPRSIPPGSVGPANVPRRYLYASGPALFSGSRGARGEFHYFNSSSLSRFGSDTYRGRPLTRGHAVDIALHWLRTAGAPIPSGLLHVRVGRGTTDIGGTGLCCFTSLAMVYWGRDVPSEGFLPEARYDVYVADAGAVVQVDMGAPAAEDAETLAHPCPGDRRDRQGVALGPWCFSYPAAARGIIFSGIGGHDGWSHDPDMLATLPLSAAHGRAGPLRRIALTASRAVYRRAVGGTTYQVTLVPAFPGLIGSTWEVIRVQVIRWAQ